MDYASQIKKWKIESEAKAFRLTFIILIIGSITLFFTDLKSDKDLFINLTKWFWSILALFYIGFCVYIIFFKPKNKRKLVFFSQERIKHKIKPNQKCPIKDWEITSRKCQQCDDYINHEIVDDHHGRVDYYLISCKYLNKQK